MNKPKLVAELVARTKAPKEIASEFVDALFSSITAGLEKGNKVALNNFGTFYLVQHKERKTAHPTSKKEVSLPALTLVKFRPSAQLKETVNRKRAV